MGREESVFVGGIPYSVTEEQIADLFRTIAPVVSFRMVIDRETGKHKGYGFCEYESQPIAHLAIKRLNGYEIEGRQLRVDTAVGKDGNKSNNNSASSGQLKDIDVALQQLSDAELYDILSEMKAYIEKDATQARKLLAKKPVLAHALLKAQARLDMLQSTPAQAQQMFNQGPQNFNARPPPNMPPAMMVGHGPRGPQGFIPQNGPPPNGNWNMPPRPMMNQQFPNQPPMMGGHPGGMPPRPMMPQPGHAMPVNIPQETIQQALSYTDEQLNSLPPQYREVILQLRAQTGRH